MTATTGTTEARQRRRSSSKPSWLLNLVGWLLFLGLLTALVYVAWINIAPYVVLMERLAPPSDNWLLAVPLVDRFVQRCGEITSTLAGVLVWAVVQILQVLWVLIRLDRAALVGAVRQASVNTRELGEQAEDDLATSNIKETARKIPYFFVRWSGYLALGAYIFDAVIGYSLYPPAKSLGVFLMALSLGEWSMIDVGNAIKLGVMLFAFESLLVMTIIAWQWASARSREG